MSVVLICYMCRILYTGILTLAHMYRFLFLFFFLEPQHGGNKGMRYIQSHKVIYIPKH